MSTPAALLAVLKDHLARLPNPPSPDEVVPLLGLLKHIQYLSSQALLAQASATAEVRTDVDRQGLEESGLSYEKRRLESEIASCEAFEFVPPTALWPWQLKASSADCQVFLIQIGVPDAAAGSATAD
jgi:hypothetical protein